ncbi:MAG: hypothetical protein JW891_12730 [Candidatus Lokiarchaeota archaeon]|nr:hypothetical protein [Candidatus Lokiarchaeota archaeon]
MTCTHGLDDNNCPICRIVRSTAPNTDLDLKNVRKNPLKPVFNKKKEDNSIKREILPSLMRDKILLRANSINLVPDMKSLNSIPTFENRIFLERIEELDLGNIDRYKISRKERLTSPELNLKND